MHQDGRWSGPAFYNMGGVSIGAQAGVSSGQIALILMDDRALRTFGQDNKFSLNADAGLTFVNYRPRAVNSAVATSSSGPTPKVYSRTRRSA